MNEHIKNDQMRSYNSHKLLIWNQYLPSIPEILLQQSKEVSDTSKIESMISDVSIQEYIMQLNEQVEKRLNGSGGSCYWELWVAPHQEFSVKLFFSLFG